ncbi:hypothetical protein IRB23SM22_07100 [Alkalibacterium sp. s-m-22]
MKNHKINYRKYIVLTAVLALGLPTVHSTYQARSEVKYDLVEEEVREITSIGPRTSTDSLTHSYVTSIDDVDIDLEELFQFVDQDGFIIDRELLEINYYHIPQSTNNRFLPLVTAFEDILLENNSRIWHTYITATAHLKENPSVSFRPAHYRWSGVVQLRGENKRPLINTINYNPTVFEGIPYEEWANIEFSDYEDDRDGRQMQRSVTYPSNFDKEHMKPGVYTIRYTVTDSQGTRVFVDERLTVAAVQAPEITARLNTIKATSLEVDLLETLDITAVDSLDGDVTDSLEIVDSNIDLKVEGEYNLTVRARNQYSKFTERTFKVNVQAESPTLKVNNLEIEQLDTFNPYIDIEYSAFDSVDGDISHLVVMSSDIDLSAPGRQFITLEVENSNSKKTTVVATVDVTEVEAPVEEEPEVEDEEVVEVEDEELEEEKEPEVEDEEEDEESEKEPELEDEETAEEVEEDEELEVETEDTGEVELEVEDEEDNSEIEKEPELEVEEVEEVVEPEVGEEEVLVKEILETIEEKAVAAVVEGETTTTEKLIKEDLEVMMTENEENELLQTGINVSHLQPLGAVLTGLSGLAFFKLKKK